MQLEIYANPYCFEASGFNFGSLEEYEKKAAALVKRGTEEWSLDWIDGEEIDRQLFKALDVCPTTIEAFLEAVDEWDEHTKAGVIMAVGDGCINFRLGHDDPERDVLDKMEIHQVDSLKELAEQFLDEGVYGPVPEALQGYIDTDIIARELGMAYCLRTVGGTNYAYSCS